MQYKSLYEQNEEMITILKMNNNLMDILNYIETLKLPNFYIAAGSVFQTVWNYFDKKASSWSKRFENLNIIEW